MKTFFSLKHWVAVVLSTTGIFASPIHAQTNPPPEWIDADTGHRVVQLSTEPGSESLYFNLNPSSKGSNHNFAFFFMKQPK